MKKNLPLIVAVLLPVVFIVGVFLIFYLPNLLLSPQYNFLYSSPDRYSLNSFEFNYKVEDGKLQLAPNTTTSPGNQKEKMPKLYVYDVKNDTSRLIEFSEAQGFDLDPNPSSPDGFTFRHERRHNGIFELFGSSGRNNEYALYKGNRSKRLSGIAVGSRYYYRSVSFIGWIK